MRPVEKYTGGYGKQLPPDPAHVSIYFEQLGKDKALADIFYRDFQRRDWKFETGGLVRNWKAVATAWIKRHCS